MPRNVYGPDHEAFRETAREFVERSLKPRAEDFLKDKAMGRDVWLEAGAQGLLGLEVPEQYGGSEAGDFRLNAVLAEELSKFTAAASSCFGIHTDCVAPYLVDLGTEEQKQRWLPGFCSGEIVTAIAMTEPSGGSDLAALKTTAVRDGDDWVLNGSKTFITNGYSADLVVVAARTVPGEGRQGHHAVRGRGRHGGLRARPQARQGRPGGVRHRRALLHRRAGPRRQPHRRGRPGLHRHDGAAAAGAHRRRGVQHRPRAADPRRDHRLRQGAQGVRPADRRLPAQQVPHRRAADQDRGHPGVRRRLRRRARRSAG